MSPFLPLAVAPPAARAADAAAQAVSSPHARARVEGYRNLPPHPPRRSLEALAARVAGLTISRTDPERFWEEKSDIAAELRALARRLPASKVSQLETPCGGSQPRGLSGAPRQPLMRAP